MAMPKFLLPYVSCFSFPGQSSVLYLDPTTTSQTKLFLFPPGCSLPPCPLVAARLCPLNSAVAIPRPLGLTLCSIVIMLPLTHRNHSTRPHLCLLGLLCSNLVSSLTHHSFPPKATLLVSPCVSPWSLLSHRNNTMFTQPRAAPLNQHAPPLVSTKLLL